MTAPPASLTLPSVGSQASAGLFGDQAAIAINFLLAPPRVGVLHSTTQSIATATFTAHLFDTETFDTDNVHSTSVNTSRFTIVTTGMYELSAAVAFAGNATGRRGGAFYKNGSILAGSEVLDYVGASAVIVPLSTFMVSLTAGDYVEVFAYQESGGALNLNPGSGASSYFQARWVATS